MGLYHITEILRENCEKKIHQNEQIWSQQVSSARATLELVKEQLQRDAEAQVAALNKKYMLQIGITNVCLFVCLCSLIGSFDVL